MALTRYMPWLAKTFLQGALSLARCCCRHCWTAVSSPSCFRQKREASREQACCSCGVPGWPPCAHAEHKPTDKNRTTNGNRDILVPPHSVATGTAAAINFGPLHPEPGPAAHGASQDRWCPAGLRC